ncbi:hypothetical protein P43SY_011078 [Pythium insidiosum]|uniref:Peptidase C1A papain C-terminal domain-containing protein n=1 Tax=Pythium insidiosum TaxID=114742 RepID=A0AAD5LRU8_PYTIN|nr:hypothetical protein P43SY_011078 [Pythium insidiosum]
MHAGIDYHRYLQEKDAIAQELDAWMKKYKDAGEKNGWIPPTESRSAEEVEEDRRQRYFMSKQLVEELERSNPDAEFSTDSPFSLLTTDEFADYVKNSYASGANQRRSLREAAEAATDPASDSESESEARVGTVETSERAVDTKFPSSFSFDDLVKWLAQYLKLPEQARVQPQPTSRPRPESPQPMPAQTPSPTPVNVKTAQPQSQSQSQTKTPTTAPAMGPVSPIKPATPSPGVGPVAPDLGPDSARRPTNEVALDGSGLDWSSHQCMPAVQNQGQCASCWAFAAVSASESAIR